MLPNSMLSPKQVMICEQIANKFKDAASDVPLLLFFSSAQFIGLLVGLSFEAALFFEIFEYLNEDEDDQVISSTMMAMMGIVVLLTFHIISIHYDDSPPVRMIRNTVFFLLPVHVVGAGALFAAIVFDSGIDGLFQGDNLKAQYPLMADILQNWVLPNAVIILIVGMIGMTAFSVFFSSYLIKALKENSRQITKLKYKADKANNCLQQIYQLQEEYLTLLAEKKRLDKEKSDLLMQSANRIGVLIAQAVNVLDTWITQKELNPHDETPENNHYSILFDKSDPQMKAIKSMPIEVLKTKRQAFMDIDAKAVLIILKF